MREGTLDPVLFGIYNLQDAVYCYKATECLKIVLKKCSSYMKQFAKERLMSYEQYTGELFQEWHISNPDSITLGTAVAKYDDFYYSCYLANILLSNGFVTVLPPLYRPQNMLTAYFLENFSSLPNSN